MAATPPGVAGPDYSAVSGVVAAIAVDHLSNRVLTVAYMNREAFDETIATGRACYFSRSRNKLWRKGEESGNFQVVHEIRIDCDADALVVAVEQRGDKAALPPIIEAIKAPEKPVQIGRNTFLCLLHSLMTDCTSAVFLGRMTAANSVLK